jgi:hypothetical protein
MPYLGQTAMETMMTTTRNTPRSGPPALFRGKTRNVVSITLTPRHRQLVEDAMRRLVLSRSDVIGLLIHRYAATVTIPARLAPDDADE